MAAGRSAWSGAVWCTDATMVMRGAMSVVESIAEVKYSPGVFHILTLNGVTPTASAKAAPNRVGPRLHRSHYRGRLGRRGAQLMPGGLFSADLSVPVRASQRRK
jgi:hypothetical protein